MTRWAEAFRRVFQGESAESVEAVDPARITGVPDTLAGRPSTIIGALGSVAAAEAVRAEQVIGKSFRLNKFDSFNRFAPANTAESPPASQAGPIRCEVCGKPGELLPFGVGPYTWLHMACWPGWFRSHTDPEAWWAEVQAGLKRLPGRAS
jgi:hypothetical protein